MQGASILPGDGGGLPLQGPPQRPDLLLAAPGCCCEAPHECHTVPTALHGEARGAGGVVKKWKRRHTLSCLRCLRCLRQRSGSVLARKRRVLKGSAT